MYIQSEQVSQQCDQQDELTLWIRNSRKNSDFRQIWHHNMSSHLLVVVQLQFVEDSLQNFWNEQLWIWHFCVLRCKNEEWRQIQCCDDKLVKHHWWLLLQTFSWLLYERWKCWDKKWKISDNSICHQQIMWFFTVLWVTKHQNIQIQSLCCWPSPYQIVTLEI